MLRDAIKAEEHRLMQIRKEMARIKEAQEAAAKARRESGSK